MHRNHFLPLGLLDIVSWMKSCHLVCWSESNFISMLSTLTMRFLLFPYFLLLVLGRYIIVVWKVMSPHWGPQIRHLSHFSSHKSVFCVFTENNLVPQQIANLCSHRHHASCNFLWNIGQGDTMASLTEPPCRVEIWNLKMKILMLWRMLSFECQHLTKGTEEVTRNKS